MNQPAPAAPTTITVGQLLRAAEQALAARDAFVPWGCMHQPESAPTAVNPDPVFAVTSATDTSPVLATASPSPRLDAEILLAHVCKCSRVDLIRDCDQVVTLENAQLFQRAIEQRADGVPVAYLTGHREFWSLDLEVSRDTLIPRPETELLVERALELLPVHDPSSVAELGTGSGAVALAIARERRKATVTATDRSNAALEVAQRNAARLGLRDVGFRAGDWLAALDETLVDLIVSNPPYIAEGDPHLQQSDVRFEPRSALIGGRDGLDAIRRIVAGARVHLRRGGWLLLEHGMTQGASVRSLLLSAGYWEVVTHRDLAGLERVTQAQWNGVE
jgi:release factor glutamine methyltransferase